MPEHEQRRNFAFLPVTLHLETLGGLATPLILRGTPLPAERVETFSTAADNQDTVEVKVLMGESRLAAKNLPVGSFKLTGIPAQLKGGPQIRVRFRIDRTCATNVTAELTGTDLRAEQTFDPPDEMSDEAIAKMVSDAETAKGDDDPVVNRIEATNRAQTLIATAEAHLRQSSDAGLSKAVADLGLAIQARNSDEIRSKSEDLKGLLTPQFDFGAFGDIFGTTRRPPTRPAAAPSAAAQKATPRGSPRSSAPTVAATKATAVVLGRIFGGGQFTLDPKLCFVLMPFGDKHQSIYDDHIRPTIESAGLRSQRADEVAGVKSITWDIWERINCARFLVADLTDRNANVFYEVGLAHALSKDVILVTQSMEFVPFDLRSVRCIEYEYTPRGTRAFESKLRGTIDSVMRSE